VEGEIQPFRKYAEVSEISQWFDEEWFKEKYVIYLPI
jgi:16S rRNA (guanine527-N7)-methyltransferase